MNASSLPLILSTVFAAGTALAQTKPVPPAEIEPKAIEALKTMGAYLRTLKTFTVRTDATKDEVLDTGQKIQFGGTVEYRVRAPDRLRADVNTDRKQRQLFYDGKTATLYGPRNKYYASVPASGTVAEVAQSVEQKYGIELPLADLFLWGSDKAGLEDIQSATYIGPARIGGADCDHYAYRQQDVDWQLWVERGKTPLPRKIVITTLGESSQPQFVAALKWDLAKLDDAVFRFTPPKDAKRIALAPAAAEK